MIACSKHRAENGRCCPAAHLDGIERVEPKIAIEVGGGTEFVFRNLWVPFQRGQRALFHFLQARTRKVEFPAWNGNEQTGT